MNLILLLGSILGFLSILIAAYVDHSSAFHVLSAPTMGSVLTAIKYHQLYAIIVCVIGLTVPAQSNIKIQSWLIRSAYLFCMGTLLFCFSIYIASIWHFPKLLFITPIGGILFILGWVGLIRAAFFKIPHD